MIPVPMKVARLVDRAERYAMENEPAVAYLATEVRRRRLAEAVFHHLRLQEAGR